MKTTLIKFAKPVIIIAFLFIFVGIVHAGDLKTAQIGSHWAQEGVILIRPAADTDPLQAAQALKKLDFLVLRASDSYGQRLPFKSLANEKSFQPSYLLVSFEPVIDPVEAAARASKLPEIEFATPNYVHRPFYVPDDPYYLSDQLNFKQIGMERVWNVSPVGDVVVGVIDSGYRTQGMEDAAPNILAGKDFESDDDDPTDYLGHGTIVSNVIAEKTDNGIGASGMASWVSILPLKVFPDQGDEALVSDIIDALYYAVDQGVDIINMSLGGGDADENFETALNFAEDAGVLLIAATGNDGEDQLAYPAGYDAVFSVGSSRLHTFGEFARRSTFSNYGTGLDIVAPGEDIFTEGYTADYGATYYRSMGTSVAAPHASAAAAWMISLGGPGTPDELAQVLRDTAAREDEGWSEKLGYGELRVSDAVSAYAGLLPNGAPTAVAVVEPATGVVPLGTILSGTGSSDPDGNIVSYTWALNDGTILFGKSVARTFESAGEYEIVLTVTDEEGLSDSHKIDLTVKPKSKRPDEKEDGCGCSVSSRGKQDAFPFFVIIGIAMLLWIRGHRKNNGREKKTLPSD